MKITINEIIHYYATADVSFCDIFTSTAEQDRKTVHSSTNGFYSGLVIPLSGSACFTLDGVPYVMEPGTIVHARKSMRLDKETIGKEPWRYAVVHYKIPENEIEQFPFYQTPFSFQTGSGAAIPDLVHELLISQGSPDPSTRFKSKRLFINLLGELFDSAEELMADTNAGVVQQIMEYFRHNCAEPITISSTAQQFGLDRRRLAVLFEKYAGMSPSNYLIECRILKAKELLRTCNCPIKQVAECVGYTDSLYFSKAFKKHIGVSPSKYQEQIKYSAFIHSEF